MKHPHWQKVEELADQFYLMYLDQKSHGHKGEVNMIETYCGDINLCGTPACHAGWYAAYGKKGLLYFTEGILDMTNNLGFKDAKLNSIERWACINYEIWGNKHGFNVFGENRAFGKSDHETLTLLDISKHWRKVAKRLWKIQNKE